MPVPGKRFTDNAKNSTIKQQSRDEGQNGAVIPLWLQGPLPLLQLDNYSVTHY